MANIACRSQGMSLLGSRAREVQGHHNLGVGNKMAEN